MNPVRDSLNFRVQARYNGRISNGVNFNQLKKLTERLGGILVLNGDEPEFVILSYDQYKKIDRTTEGLGLEGEDDEKTIDKLNQEILALKEEIRQKESAELAENTEEEPTPPYLES